MLYLSVICAKMNNKLIHVICVVGSLRYVKSRARVLIDVCSLSTTLIASVLHVLLSLSIVLIGP